MVIEKSEGGPVFVNNVIRTGFCSPVLAFFSDVISSGSIFGSF